MNRTATGAVRELPATVADDRPTEEHVPVPLAWAPVDACTLPTPEQPLREAEFDALFAAALRGVERPAPSCLRLHLDAGAEARTRDLIARESSCCSFFDFRLIAAGGALTLDVRVPEARVPVLDGLARLAAAARAAAATESGTRA